MCIEFVVKTCPENDGWEVNLVGRYIGPVVCGLSSKQASLSGFVSMLAWISAHFEKVSVVCIVFRVILDFEYFFSLKNLQWSGIKSAEMHIWNKIEQLRIYYQQLLQKTNSNRMNFFCYISEGFYSWGEHVTKRRCSKYQQMWIQWKWLKIKEYVNITKIKIMPLKQLWWLNVT